MRINLKKETLAGLAVLASREDVTIDCWLREMITFCWQNKVNNKKSNKHQKPENKSKILSCLIVPKFQTQISDETGINLSTVKSLIKRMLKAKIVRKSKDGYQSAQTPLSTLIYTTIGRDRQKRT